MILDHPRGSRLPGYIGIGVTTTLLAATVASFLKFNALDTKLADDRYTRATFYEEYVSTQHRWSRWRNITIGAAAAMIVAGGATVFVWNRHASQRSFSVQPTSTADGAGAELVLSW